jgi:hypothetical protein
MLHADLARVRALCARLRELIIHRSGGWDDAPARHELELYCRGMQAEIDDAQCRAAFKSLAQYGADLFSVDRHARFARKNTSGADFLRLQILRELEALQSRLLAIETARSASMPGAPGRGDDSRDS